MDGKSLRGRLLTDYGALYFVFSVAEELEIYISPLEA